MSAPEVLQLQSNKALPSIVKENLPLPPPPPPPPSREDPTVPPFTSSTPKPPPKFTPAQELPSHSNGFRPLPIDVAASNTNEFLGQGINPLLSTPSTPSSPSSPSSPDTRAKRSNPLVDLIETEKLYVDQLTGIIRKVASAWSRTNLPPHELDLMFRSIESVYKADRSLLSRLKEIGTNPSSPKVLGDLLMRWIGELETPYTSYCERYCTDFDIWEPVRNNSRLSDVLAAFSASLPPPSTSSVNTDSSIWTLDELFLLPKGRLKYFKKLYGRLLKGTQPGRSDYKLLAGAAVKLDKLLAILDARADVKAGSSTPATLETVDEVVVDFRSPAEIPNKRELPAIESATGSETNSAGEPNLSSVSSNDIRSSSIERGPTDDLLIPLPDLESRLAVENCMDIFTMKPRRAASTPPDFASYITLREDHEDRSSFIMRADGARREKLREPGADMWLLYPPLAGKHLKIVKTEDEDCALQVTVLRKEKLLLVFSSAAMRDRVLSELNECIEFANAVHASSKHPVPPMPTLNGSIKLEPTPMDGIPSSQTAPNLHQSNVSLASSRSPSPHRVSSPIGSLSSSASRHGSGPPSRNSHDTTPMSLTNSMSNLVLSLEAQIQRGGDWVQPVHEPHSGPMYPVRQPSQSELLNDNVGQSQAAGGTSLGPISTLKGLSPQPVAPIPRASPLPGQIISPGQFLPPQRTASAEPLGRRGPPSGLVHPQQPMHGADPPFVQRGPQRLLPNPVTGQFIPPNPPYNAPPSRTPSDPSFQGGILRSSSAFPLTSQQEGHTPPFDAPPHPGMASSSILLLPRANSFGSMSEPQSRPILPSAQLRAPSVIGGSLEEPSPPTSPTMDNRIPTGPVTSTISAQMRCKVFLKQGHAQWKSLGSAKLKLYREQPTNVKQLVVEAEDKNKSVLISTIILTDGVERVGKTGVAVELSDGGSRTGIIYMIQLRNEQAAVGLYEGLLAGSDRTLAR
ncbi:hypothetical protein B0F90DRAFT_1664754 [Multifurca ochricompacta]|uniref:DH domain-containing protein n=1 Tax=Multifurca ochricompacta TaxID=376703 RepID=A0AAD4MD73_9AGAM|nr:hypothetical protein B0F90DRAFT_1664754 [Multifurca ochricompacta]